MCSKLLLSVHYQNNFSHVKIFKVMLIFVSKQSILTCFIFKNFLQNLTINFFQLSSDSLLLCIFMVSVNLWDQISIDGQVQNYSFTSTPCLRSFVLFIIKYARHKVIPFSSTYCNKILQAMTLYCFIWTNKTNCKFWNNIFSKRLSKNKTG